MESLKEPRTISADKHLSQDLASRFPSLQWWVWIFKVPSCSNILCHSGLSRHLKSLAVSSWSTCKRPNIGLRTRDTGAWKEMFLPEPGMPENSGAGTAPDSNAFKLISSTDPSCSLPLSLLNLARLTNHRQRSPGQGCSVVALLALPMIPLKPGVLVSLILPKVFGCFWTAEENHWRMAPSGLCHNHNAAIHCFPLKTDRRKKDRDKDRWKVWREREWRETDSWDSHKT